MINLPGPGGLAPGGGTACGGGGPTAGNGAATEKHYLIINIYETLLED